MAAIMGTYHYDTITFFLLWLINYEYFKGRDPEVYKDEEWSEVAAITLDKK